MIISIVVTPSIKYPTCDNLFDHNTPVYKKFRRHVHLALNPHPIFDAVEGVFSQADFDQNNLETSNWNPLRKFINPGSRVFILCNFVYQRRLNETKQNFYGKCTHGSVLAAIIDYCLRANGPNGDVYFGNAPLQSCHWESVLSDTGALNIYNYCKERGMNVKSKDLRLFVAERGWAGNIGWIEKRNDDEGIEVDLGEDSLLEELYRNNKRSARFRISDYNPARLEEFHKLHSHRYIIHKDILESDVILSLPKLKTHEKVGVTCGLKGFVGTIGHKDCLAHHRFGGPEISGDEYPMGSISHHLMSSFHDYVYSGGYPGLMSNLLHIVDKNLRRLYKLSGGISAGAWYGNDTAWRMALDIARIVYYADKSGKMCDIPQRRHLSLIDGIIGGEGNGPLSPKAVDSGVLIFSDNVAMGDRIACRLMGYDPNDIPIVREAFHDMRYSLVPDKNEDIIMRYNGKYISEEEITSVVGRPFVPPDGWRKYLRDKKL